jgi:hypothetical protein
MKQFDPEVEARTDRSADDGVLSNVGTVTAEYIAADLRALAVPIDSLRRMPGNARAHCERDLAAIEDSLRAHGQQRPIVAARTYRGTEHAIIAGCGTWQAARRFGWRWIAVSWFEGSDTDAATYSVRDNRTSELSRFDESALAALAADADLDLLTLGWTGAELADLLVSAPDAPVPHFEPVESAHRLDELQPHCRTCTCRHGAKA